MNLALGPFGEFYVVIVCAILDVIAMLLMTEPSIPLHQIYAVRFLVGFFEAPWLRCPVGERSADKWSQHRRTVCGDALGLGAWPALFLTFCIGGGYPAAHASQSGQGIINLARQSEERSEGVRLPGKGDGAKNQGPVLGAFVICGRRPIGPSAKQEAAELEKISAMKTRQIASASVSAQQRAAESSREQVMAAAGFSLAMLSADWEEERSACLEEGAHT
ncbi:unnamed protein product [Symbiodinium necroappetens]|uniref:Uncharacterized protein n=1 Tax=Symbiodinium necroappetens TaxID=1628268 RepID=A0A812UN12_9DINO|nr:unnamed protein product [Symbiodinium necroappetens]